MPACRQWCSVQKAAVYFAGNRKEFTGASYVPEIAYRAEEPASFSVRMHNFMYRTIKKREYERSETNADRRTICADPSDR